MLTSKAGDTESKNKRHYDNVYSKVDIKPLVSRIRNLDHFLSGAIAGRRMLWHCLYWGDFRDKLNGCKVLELGAGDGLNALAMGALGAQVVAVDISEATPVIIREAADQLGLLERVSAFAGDFLSMSFEPCTFDFVVGKAFLHHLEPDTEAAFLRKTAMVLKPTGEARFVEPAVNSALLDRLRYCIPVPGRASSLNRTAFRAREEAQVHPIRSDSSAHFREAASKEFRSVEIVCFGCIQRFARLVPRGKFQRSFSRVTLRCEKFLPRRLNDLLARTQLIICKEPKLRFAEPAHSDAVLLPN